MCTHKWKTTQGIFQVWKDCELCGMKFEDYLKEGEKKIYALGGIKSPLFSSDLTYKDAKSIINLARYYATEHRYSSFEQVCAIEFDNAIKTMQKGLESQLFYGTSITKEDK